MLEDHLDEREIRGNALPRPGVPGAAEDLPLRPVRSALGHRLGQKETRQVPVVGSRAQQGVDHPARSGGDDLDLRQEHVGDSAFHESLRPLAYGAQAGELILVFQDEPPRRTWLTNTSWPLMWIVASSASGWNSPSTT